MARKAKTPVKKVTEANADHLALSSLQHEITETQNAIRRLANCAQDLHLEANADRFRKILGNLTKSADHAIKQFQTKTDRDARKQRVEERKAARKERLQARLKKIKSQLADLD